MNRIIELFCKNLISDITMNITDPNVAVIWGGDHNFVLDINKDRFGGNPKLWSQSLQLMLEMMES